jgi:hypothetical protein
MLNPKSLQAFAKSDGYEPEIAGEENETEDAVTEGEDRLQFLRPLVEMYAAEYDGLWGALSAEVLEDPETPLDELSWDILVDQLVEVLDEKFVEALRTVPDLSFEEANELAEHAAGEGLVSESGDLAMWLFRLANVLAADPAGAETAYDEESETEDVEGSLPAEDPVPA